MNIYLDFLLALTEPQFSRLEFWEIKQSQSGFTPLTYWKKLNEAWQYYYNKINAAEIEQGGQDGNLINLKLPLLIETKGVIEGHFGKEELSKLQISLFEYGKNLKQNLFLYANDINISINSGVSPARQFEIWHEINAMNFRNELGKISVDILGEYLNLNFSCFEQLVKDEKNCSELKKMWLKNTRKHLPTNYTLKLRDYFLLWFDQMEEKQFPKNAKQAQEIQLKLCKLITHPKNRELVEHIKVQYKNIKGKQLKLLLIALQDLKLLPKDRIVKKFYDCCKIEFDWDIASYIAVNDYRFNSHSDSATLNEMKLDIESVIKTN